jgi:phage head maturation protease
MEEDIRVLDAVELFETSLVAVPANDGARVAQVKSHVATIREFEHMLKTLGWSKSEAK